MQSQLARSSTCRAVCKRIQPFRQVTTRVAEANGSALRTADTPVDFEELSDILRLVNTTDIVELELKSKRFNMTVRKKEAMVTPEPVMQMMHAPQFSQQIMAAPAPAPAAALAPAAAPAAAAPAPAAAAPAPAAKPAAGGIELVSPMGGTFYRSPAPGEPAFCKEGDKVTKGQVIGLIEAMKLMNEIEAEASGEIVAIMVENGKPVSTGQPLFMIKP